MDPIWGNMTQYTKIIWGWEIAIYLFLAGLSAGALISAILTKWRGGMGESRDGIVKSGALIACPAICAGLGLLIVDLGKPLDFYQLMFRFNLQSVMSIGVILLSVYSALTALFAAVVFKRELAESDLTGWIFRPFQSLVEQVESFGKWFDWIMVALAVAIAAYTGFLLSALVAKPLLNAPVLPILFLISGISSGVAGCVAVSLLLFRDSIGESNLKRLLSLDMKLLPAELFVLFVLFTGLFNMGGRYAEVASAALTTGLWANVFWIGVVGVGLLLPLVISLTSLRSYEESESAIVPYGTLLLNTAFILVGVILLRFYILYAGQTFI